MALNEKALKAAADNVGAQLQNNLFGVEETATPKTKGKRGRKPQPQNANKLVVTFAIDSAIAENVRKIADWERTTQAAVVDEALRQYCNNWDANAKPQTPPTLTKV